MALAREFQVIDGGHGDLPEYPISRDVRFDGLPFIKWQPQRWLGSTLAIRATHEVKSMARDLFDMSYAQSPIGTLPHDLETLAIMLRVEAGRFRQLCELPYGPLHRWHPCRCGDEVRLMHPVILENVEDVLHRREARKQSGEDAARRMRKSRTRKALVALGAAPAVLDDDILAERIEVWLSENYRERGQESYAAVMAHAERMGWVDHWGVRG